MSRSDQRTIGAYVRDQVGGAGVTRFSAGRISRATGVSLEESAKFFLNHRREFRPTVSVSCPGCGATLANREESSQRLKSLYCAVCAKMVDESDEDSIVYFDLVDARRERFMGKSEVARCGDVVAAPASEVVDCEVVPLESHSPVIPASTDLTEGQFQSIRLKEAWGAVRVLGGIFVLTAVMTGVLVWCTIPSTLVVAVIVICFAAAFLFLGLAKIGDIAQILPLLLKSSEKKE